MRNVERAKKIATEKGINVSFVCREIGKSRGYISQMLVSGRDFPDEMLAPVANALGVPVEELTGESEQKEKPSGLPAGLDVAQYTPEQLEVLNAVTEKIQTEEGCKDMYNLLKAMHIL